MAAEMIETHLVDLFFRSEVPVLLGWIDKLPSEIVRARPWIDVYRANTLALTGRADAADALLDGVELRVTNLERALVDVLDRPDLARRVEQAVGRVQPIQMVERLLSDNGPAFVSKPLANYLKTYRMKHVRGRPHHPQTQGKIERYHRSMKSIVKLNTFFFPWELEHAIADFVAYYNYERYHESLDNVTPADVYFGRQQELLTQRELIKQQTLLERRRINLRDEVYMV